MLKLHESVTIPSLLYASETWVLSAIEAKQIDRIELWALKKMFGLPSTTPTPAVRFMTGTLYAVVRIQIKQLVYLYDLLHKEDGHWAKEALNVLVTNDVGWGKQIMKTLDEWGLESDFDKIKERPKPTWIKEVNQAAEKRNKSLLMEDCQNKQRGVLKEKTKTRTIIRKLECEEYKRNPSPLLCSLSCLMTRALIMGRYGMLQCRANYSCGSGVKLCNECGVDDNESHRINYCPKYRNVNCYDNMDKVDFDDIHSDDMDIVIPVIETILAVWDLQNGKNNMREG